MVGVVLSVKRSVSPADRVLGAGATFVAQELPLNVASSGRRDNTAHGFVDNVKNVLSNLEKRTMIPNLAEQAA